MKVCRVCGEEKPLTEFSVHPRMRDGHRNNCKKCQAEYSRMHYRGHRFLRIEQTRKWRESNPEHHRETTLRWREENRERVRLGQRRRWLRHKYGIELSDYAAMLAVQHGVCAICRNPSEGYLHVDHDHGTGRVRGLLCFKCNALLGNASEDIAILARAAEYLLRCQALERL